MEQFLEEAKAYAEAPIGTVVEDAYGMVVKRDGDVWTDPATGARYVGRVFMVARKVIHTFRLGETITAKTKPWLPPDAKVEDGFLIEFPGMGRALYSFSDYDSALVGTIVETGCGGTLLTKTWRGWEFPNGLSTYSSSDLANWPRVVVDRYAVGNTLYSKADYDNAPVGTKVELIGVGEAPEPVKQVDPRVDGERTVKYSHNKAKGTVYAYDGGFAHRDFGRIVKLSGSRFLAVPNRTPREFLTEQDAINYLL